MGGEWQALRGELDRRGVAGSEDLGRFASDPEFFEPSRLDEHAAMPVLVDSGRESGSARCCHARTEGFTGQDQVTDGAHLKRLPGPAH